MANARRTVGVLVIQNGPASWSVEENVEQNIRLLRQETADYRPDYVLFSELSTTPYFCGCNDPKHFGLAEPLDGSSIGRFREEARRLGAYVFVPFYEQGLVRGEFYNSVAVIGADGELVSGVLPDGRTVRCYRKNHIPDQYSYAPGLNERYYFKGGPGLPTFATRGARIGFLTCYERSFPEAWRVLALAGAEIVFLPVAAWGPNRAASWAIELRAAALQNGVFVVSSNKGGSETTEAERRFFGQSLVVTPMGEILAEGPPREGPAVLRCTLDLGEVDRHGARYTFFRDRRPELYGSLAEVARRVD